MSDQNLNEAKTKEQIIKEEFSRLCGNPVTVSEAENRFALQNQTIRNWVTLGYIRVVDNDYPMKLNEADVAYKVQPHFFYLHLSIMMTDFWPLAAVKTRVHGTF